MTTKANGENLRQNKSRFSLIIEQILAFASTINRGREVENVSRTSKTITF